MQNIEVGDHVTIGESGRIHWVVFGFKEFYGSRWVMLRSGMTGRTRLTNESELKLYKRRDKADLLLASRQRFDGS